VIDIRHTIDAMAAKGIQFERYARLDQDQRGIWHSPGGADVAWFKDPDGNMLSLTEWTGAHA
jgi:hypothetical protein